MEDVYAFWPDAPDGIARYCIHCHHLEDQIQFDVFYLPLMKSPTFKTKKKRIGWFKFKSKPQKYFRMQISAMFTDDGKYGLVFCNDETATLICFPVTQPWQDIELTGMGNLIELPRFSSGLFGWRAYNNAVALFTDSHLTSTVFSLPSLEKMDFDEVFHFQKQLKTVGISLENEALVKRLTVNCRVLPIDSARTLYYNSSRESDGIRIKLFDMERGCSQHILTIPNPSCRTTFWIANGVTLRGWDGSYSCLFTVRSEGQYSDSILPISIPPRKESKYLNGNRKEPEENRYWKHVDFIRTLRELFPQKVKLKFKVLDAIPRPDLNSKLTIADYVLKVFIHRNKSTRRSMVLVLRYDNLRTTLEYNRLLAINEDVEHNPRHPLEQTGFQFRQNRSNYYGVIETWPTIAALWNLDLIQRQRNRSRLALGMFQRYSQSDDHWLSRIPADVWQYHILPFMNEPDILHFGRATPYLLVFLVRASPRLNAMILDRLAFNMYLSSLQRCQTQRCQKRCNGWLLLGLRAGHPHILDLIKKGFPGGLGNPTTVNHKCA